MAVAQLKEAVAHGLKNDQSIQTPDLITFDESVARALYRYTFRNVCIKFFRGILSCGIIFLCFVLAWKPLKHELKRLSLKPKLWMNIENLLILLGTICR